MPSDQWFKRRFHSNSKLRTILLLLCLVSFVLWTLFRLLPRSYPPPTPPFVFGVISDLQYADVPDGINKDTGRPRFYRDSLRKLSRAVKEWERNRVKCVVDLGDILDGSSGRNGRQQEDLNSLEVALSNLTVPYYHLLGNHDLDNLDFSEWIRITHLKIQSSNSFRESEYSEPESRFQFSFSPTPNLRFIYLNSFALGVVGHKQDHTESEDRRLAWKMLRSKNRNMDPNSDAGLGSGVADRRWTAFNAALGEKQRKWMEEELQKAEQRRERVVLFSHIPLHPEVSKFIAWDYEEALNVLERYRKTILVVISGHDHDGGHHYDKQRNIAFLTLEGAVEKSVGESAHYVAQISEKMTIRGHNVSVVIDPVKGNMHYCSILGSD